jgi:hypothetical protein
MMMDCSKACTFGCTVIGDAVLLGTSDVVLPSFATLFFVDSAMDSRHQRAGGVQHALEAVKLLHCIHDRVPALLRCLHMTVQVIPAGGDDVIVHEKRRCVTQHL